MVSPEITIAEAAAVAAAVVVTEKVVEVGTEETVEVEGKIEEAVVAVDEEVLKIGLVVEAVTEDVDVDHHLIVQCQEADLDLKVLQGEDVLRGRQDLAPDQNNLTRTKQKNRRIITLVSH